MNCKACRVEIEESETPESLSHGASVHLESCLNCRSFREEHLALKKMIDSLEVVAAPADFDFRLRARLAAVRSDGRGHFTWSRFAPGAWSLAVAAAFVVIIAVGLIIKQAWIAPSAPVRREEVVIKNPDNVGVPSAAPDMYKPPNRVTEIPAGLSNSGLKGAAVAHTLRGAGRGKDGKSQEVANRANSDEDIHSRDSASTPPANSVLPPGIPDPLTHPRSIVAVPVRASMQPTTITFNDGAAGPQTISLRPVTFGGQDVFEQERAKKVLVPIMQGIW